MLEKNRITVNESLENTWDEDRRRFNANCWRQVLLLGKLAVYRYQREEKN